MKCPACFDELSPLTVGELTVDACRGGCGGIWFDAFELRRADETRETVGERLVHIDRDPATQVDSLRKRSCPKCHAVKLQRHFFSPKRTVEVDSCPGCGGCWLDAGELARIREEMNEAARALETETLMRPPVSAAVIRYVYQMRTELSLRTTPGARPVR